MDKSTVTMGKNVTILTGAQSVALGGNYRHITVVMSPDATVTEFAINVAASGKAKLWAGDSHTFHVETDPHRVAEVTLYYHGAGAATGSFTVLAEG